MTKGRKGGASWRRFSSSNLVNSSCRQRQSLSVRLANNGTFLLLLLACQSIEIEILNLDTSQELRASGADSNSAASADAPGLLAAFVTEHTCDGTVDVGRVQPVLVIRAAGEMVGGQLSARPDAVLVGGHLGPVLGAAEGLLDGIGKILLLLRGHLNVLHVLVINPRSLDRRHSRRRDHEMGCGHPSTAGVASIRQSTVARRPGRGSTSVVLSREVRRLECWEVLHASFGLLVAGCPEINGASGLSQMLLGGAQLVASHIHVLEARLPANLAAPERLSWGRWGRLAVIRRPGAFRAS